MRHWEESDKAAGAQKNQIWAASTLIEIQPNSAHNGYFDRPGGCFQGDPGEDGCARPVEAVRMTALSAPSCS